MQGYGGKRQSAVGKALSQERHIPQRRVGVNHVIWVPTWCHLTSAERDAGGVLSIGYLSPVNRMRVEVNVVLGVFGVGPVALGAAHNELPRWHADHHHALCRAGPGVDWGWG